MVEPANILKEYHNDQTTSLEIEIETLRLAAAEQEQLVRDGYVRSDNMLQEVLDDKFKLKENEKSLAAANEFTNLVLDTMDEVLIVFGTDGKIQRVNNKLADLLGYSASELIGCNADRLFTDSSLKHCQQFFDSGLSASDSTIYQYFSWNPLKQIELALLSENRQQILHDFRGSILHNYQGKKIGIVIVGVDIRELKSKNKMLNSSLRNLEEAHKQIIDSIQYARIIQSSLLPDMEVVKSFLPHSFFIWEPRDVIGGDIYHVFPQEDESLIVSLFDCTGHGVPGAFMTMLASGKLHQLIRSEKLYAPAELLKCLNQDIRATLHQDADCSMSNDGLDAVICRIDRRRNTLTYSGAKIPLFIIQDNKVTTVKPDRQSLGYQKSDSEYNFTSHSIHLGKDMSFYIFTDGFTEQVGGEKKLPFGNTRLKKLLLENHRYSFDRQEEIIRQAYEKYRGNHQRRDDMTIIGFSTKR